MDEEKNGIDELMLIKEKLKDHQGHLDELLQKDCEQQVLDKSLVETIYDLSQQVKEFKGISQEIRLLSARVQVLEQNMIQSSSNHK